MNTTEKPAPCPHCGCPYPGDHTLDCPVAQEHLALGRSQLEKEMESLKGIVCSQTDILQIHQETLGKLLQGLRTIQQAFQDLSKDSEQTLTK